MINEGRFKLKGDGTANYRCFCKHPELIENYDKAIADTTQTWDCHHRLETHNSDGERRSVDLTAAELMALGTYHDRPPEELIFLTHSEHTRLHSAGRKFSEEHKAKMSAIRKGKKHGPHSEETKAKISAALKGRPSKRKRMHCKLLILTKES